MMSRFSLSFTAFLSVFVLGVFCGLSLSLAKDNRAEPEAATGWQERAGRLSSKRMVVAANPYASRAGFKVLSQGGNAIDAAIAVQMVLNLVEPQSSGLGGGAFILHWDRQKKQLKSYDGRETAPLAAKADRFLLADGRPMEFYEARFGGLSVGVPGLLQVLKLTHERHGKRPWASLFLPAIALAEEGFLVSPRLHKLLQAAGPQSFGKKAQAYFFDEKGQAWPVGHRLKNKAFAESLRLISARGIEVFYHGEIGKAIALRVQETLRCGAKKICAGLSMEDLEAYLAKERASLCIPYRTFKICGMGPPSSGGLTIAQTLKLLEPYDLGREVLNGPALHLIAEAEKLAYADRNRYMADPDFVEIPRGLLDDAYLARRRLLIDPDKTMGAAKPGVPDFAKKSEWGTDRTVENSGTSHISIVDEAGNAVSMTTTIESAFGAHIMVRGFLLNNELTDFSFYPKDAEGRLIANRIEPGKRPRSSMAPTLVFDKEGELRMTVGSPGGSRIILYVLKSLIAHIDWGQSAQGAAVLVNFGSRNGPFEIEKGRGAEDIARKMRAYGHQIYVSDMTSGTHIIIKNAAGLEGGVDPRREGLAIGD